MGSMGDWFCRTMPAAPPFVQFAPAAVSSARSGGRKIQARGQENPSQGQENQKNNDNEIEEAAKSPGSTEKSASAR